jgi:hypothetical protein
MKNFNLSSNRKKIPHVLDHRTSKGDKDLRDVDHPERDFYTDKQLTKRLYQNGSHFKWSNERIVEIFTENSSLRNAVFPMLISLYIRDRRISRQEAETVREMLRSDDTENWILAISILKQMRKNFL